MDEFRELLACPACSGTLADDWSCLRCSARFTIADGVPNLRLPGNSRTEIVRRFYERAPFPGYAPRETLPACSIVRSTPARAFSKWAAAPDRCVCTSRERTGLSSAPI